MPSPTTTGNRSSPELRSSPDAGADASSENRAIAAKLREAADLLQAQSIPVSHMTRATPELCQLIDSLIDSLIGSSAVPPEATLSDIPAVVLGDGIFVSGEGELLYPQDRTFLVIELDELIERPGMQAAARDFTGRARA